MDDDYEVMVISKFIMDTVNIILTKNKIIYFYPYAVSLTHQAK